MKRATDHGGRFTPITGEESWLSVINSMFPRAVFIRGWSGSRLGIEHDGGEGLLLASKTAASSIGEQPVSPSIG